MVRPGPWKSETFSLARATVDTGQEFQRLVTPWEKLLALAELVASDHCDLRYHNLRIEGEQINYHPDLQWTKELLWGGRRTITLTLVVEPTNGS